MLATKVIATGVTHLTDARYFAAWEVAVVGFDLSTEGIDWVAFDAMREWIEGPAIAVEPKPGADAGAVIEGLKSRGLNLAVLPPTAPAALPTTLTNAGLTVVATLAVAGYQSTDDVREGLAELGNASAVILDFESGGITWNDLTDGHPFTLRDLRALLASGTIYLRIDLTGADPKAIVAEYPIAGFAVRGSTEEKVGYKSFDDLDPLFEGLEVFD